MMAAAPAAVAKPRARGHIRAMNGPRLFPLAFTMLAALTAGAGAASSGWHEVEGGAVRLVTGGEANEAGALRAALEIRLKPGWKTYWRDPGASGVPPTLAARADGAQAPVEIGFPPPARFDDGYASSAGYDRPLALALEFSLPEGASLPARLSADIFLGVCETICIPVQATLSLALSDGDRTGADAAAVEAAFAALPTPARPGFAAGAAAIADDAITVEATLPEGVHALDLFVAGTDELVLGMAERAGEAAIFRVPIAARSDDAAARLPYTLVTDAGAVSGFIELPRR